MKNNYIKPIHKLLLKDYKSWKKNTFPSKKKLFEKLYLKGQKPNFMILGCCDSRVNISSIFNEKEGSFFTHRNIANIVPTYRKQVLSDSTEATIQYAVSILKVKSIIILGHSNCGGVKSFLDNFQKKSKYNDTDFIFSWLKNLKPLIKEKTLLKNKKLNYKYFEQSNIKLSLKNLLTYPFVKEAIKNKELNITGLWYDIKNGNIEQYEPIEKEFKNIIKN